MRWSSASIALVAVTLAGCGGNSTGVSSKDDGFDPSSGSSDGNGSATGNGSTDPTNAGSVGLNGGTTTTGAYVPQTCGASSPCPSGQVCSTQGGGDRGVGYCVQTCTLPEGITMGKSTCIGATICVRLEQSSAGACVLPCKTDLDCPALVGLEAACVSIGTTGPRFCVWGQQATPGGG
jgi:hypothetical protein